ncbi:MAG: sigma-70 family RNA polymerase sigma factor [Pseudomonadales bacterium]
MNKWSEDDQRWSSLLNKAQKGDQASYEALLHELAAVIRAYLVARFGASDNLEDYVQESLIAIHKARHTYDASRPFRPWLFAIVRHKTIDCIRQGVEAQELPAEQSYEQDCSRLLDGTKLLGNLSRKLSEPLILTKFIGLSQVECAQRLGVSVSVVKVRVHRAMKQLQATWIE